MLKKMNGSRQAIYKQGYILGLLCDCKHFPPVVIRAECILSIPWMIEIVVFIQTLYSKNIIFVEEIQKKDPQNAGNRISDGLNFKIVPLYQFQWRVPSFSISWICPCRFHIAYKWTLKELHLVFQGGLNVCKRNSEVLFLLVCNRGNLVHKMYFIQSHFGVYYTNVFIWLTVYGYIHEFTLYSCCS